MGDGRQYRVLNTLHRVDPITELPIPGAPPEPLEPLGPYKSIPAARGAISRVKRNIRDANAYNKKYANYLYILDSRIQMCDPIWTDVK